jgi:hypothetical protein
MQASIFLAQLLGPAAIVLALAVLFKPKRMEAALKEVLGSPALLFEIGFLSLLAGLALVLTHNIWVLDWRLLITLLGWVTIVRAVITIFQPEWFVVVATHIFARREIAGVINLIIGLVLSYFGYTAT